MNPRDDVFDLPIEMPAFEDPLCAQIDSELFFPHTNGDPKPAKTICGHCVDQTACLTWALESQQQHGIYGGMTPHERRQLLRHRRAA